MYKETPPQPQLTNIIRTRTGCDACRRRKKKCDEGKPECAACVRLGIRCEVSRPSFEFVNGTTSTFRDHNKNRRRTIQTRQSRTPGHISIDGGSGGRELNSPRGPAPANDEENCFTALHNGPTSAQEESTPPVSEKRLSTVVGMSEAPPENGNNRFDNTPDYSTRSDLASSRSSSLNMSTATVDLPQLKISDVINEPVPWLEAWFSSFVDLSVPISESLAYDSLADSEAHVAEMEDGFYELQENLYLRYWRNDLLTALPTPYEHIESLAEGFPALRPAIIALSACDMAQARAEVRSRTIDFEKQWFYAPNMEHQRYGRRYYNMAMRELAEMDYDRQDKVPVLATLLLFVLIESHIGTFRGAAFHHHGIEHLLSSYHCICERSVAGRGLIGVWTALRAQNWSCRIPFTLFDFQKSLLEIGIDMDLMLDPTEARAEAVIVNMLQSWRLSLMMLFERYTGRGDMESISSRSCRDVYWRIQQSAMTQPWAPKIPIPDENYESLLGEQRRKLDAWHEALPLSHLPIESFRSENAARQLSQFNYSMASECCLKFQSHQAAMNYACYVVTRIVQSDVVLEEYLSMKPFFVPEQGHSEINHWLLILLRIIAGLDIIASVRHNFYSVSLLEIVKMCQLRLPRCSSIIRRLADQLVEEFTNHCITYDGSVLISNFRYDFQEVEEQRVLAKDLFYVMPRFSPDAKKQPDYIHISPAPTIAYGRDRITGKLFCGSLIPRRES